MASKTVNELDPASLPLNPTDSILVSRDGVNLTRAPFSSALGKTIAVNASRNLTASDNGKTLQVTASNVTLTVPPGLVDFGCTITTKGNFPIVAAGAGVSLNGAATSITILSSMGAIVPDVASNSYTVVGG